MGTIKVLLGITPSSLLVHAKIFYRHKVYLCQFFIKKSRYSYINFVQSNRYQEFFRLMAYANPIWLSYNSKANYARFSEMIS